MTAPHDRTADQLDAWLDAASQRHSRPSSPNGATDPGAYDLVTTVHEFHASIRAAEQRVVPAIPAKAIWEDVMTSTTAGTISIPALTPSGADSPPSPPTRPTADSGWPKPGHWAVPAFLVVAAMVGILWFYSSFFGSSSTPEPTLQPGFAFSTPTDDISEWLVDPSTYSCEDGFAATVTPESRPVDGWPTDRPMDVNDYLPMTNAPATEQRAIAERYQQMNTNCLPTSEEPLISDDFHWMPGPSVAIATDDQIESAQQISAALPMQDYRDYYIIQPPSLGTPAAVESSLNGTGVLLPRDVVQLADGRIGAPLRIVVEGDNADEAIHALTGGRNLAPPVFMVFEWDGERWLYDELFLICIGDCDEYWAVIAGDLPVDTLATPAASPVASPVTTQATPAASLQPITPSECTVEGLSQEEVSAIIRSAPGSSPRSWDPVGPVDATTADQVSQVDRAWQACDAFGSIGQRTVFQTDHLTSTGFERSVDEARTDEDIRLWFERFDQRRDLGNALLLSMETYLPTAESIFDTYGSGQEPPFDQRISLPVPNAAILLADGRIALPISVPMTHAAWEENQSPESDFPYIYMPVHILEFDPDSNSWLVDEVIEVCVGDCDAALARVIEWANYNGIAVPGTPAASPVATPTAIDGSLLDPGECSVTSLTNEEISALQQDPGTFPARQYGPTSPVDDALAGEIAELDREFQACANDGNWRSMASQRLIYETRATGNYAQIPTITAPRGLTGDEYLAWHRDLSTTLLPGDISDYVVLSDRDIATMTGYVVQPHQVVQLSDGRIGAPQSLVLPSNYDVGGIPSIIMSFNIYIQEAAMNDRWVLDESLLLCVGECDAFYQQMARDLSVLPATPTSPAASPVATPEGGDIARWLVNPDEIDCDRNVDPLPDTFPNPEGTITVDDYLPLSEADPETQIAIARHFQLLAANCAPGPDGIALISEDINAIPVPSGGPVTQEQLDLAIALSEAVSTGDPLDFVLEADPGLISPIGYEQITASMGIMFPESVVQLPDGRYGAPLHVAIETIDPSGARGLIAEQGGVVTPLLIFTMPENGSPQLDEVIWICLGDCDDYWASYEITESPTATPIATPGATPAATPVDNRATRAR